MIEVRQEMGYGTVGARVGHRVDANFQHPLGGIG